MKKVLWFVYILGVGLIPFLLRLSVFIFTAKNNTSFHPVNEMDFIFLGLIINITSLKELFDLDLYECNLGDSINKEELWKLISFIVSIVLIAVLSGLIVISYLNTLDIIKHFGIYKILSVVLGIVSVIFGLSIITRVYNIINHTTLINIKKNK